MLSSRWQTELPNEARAEGRPYPEPAASCREGLAHFVPIPEPRLEQFRGVGSKAGHWQPGLGSGLGPWIGARVAPQESPILRPGQWRLSLRLGSATIAR